MANHCYNYGYFEGSKEDIKKASQAIINAKESDGHLWWETYKKVFGDKYDYSSEDVYTEFGSKWFDCDIDFNDHSMTLSGDSAWSPTLAFFQKICETFNLSCSADYEEPGMDFGGWWECRNGVVMRDDTASWLIYIDTNDPGRMLECLLDDVDNDYYKSYNEFISSTQKEILERLTTKEKEKIRNKIKHRNNEVNTNK